jgi:hypothetical protein
MITLFYFARFSELLLRSGFPKLLAEVETIAVKQPLKWRLY